MFRKLFVGLMVSAILFCTLAHFPLFKWKQSSIRREIKQRIKRSVPQDELFVFHFSNPETDVLWLREGKEFRFKGSLYDVVRRKTQNGKEVLYCINDKQETILFAHLDEYVQKYLLDHSKNSKKKGNLNASQMLNLFVSDCSIKIDWKTTAKSKAESCYFFKMKTNPLTLDSPPPKA